MCHACDVTLLHSETSGGGMEVIVVLVYESYVLYVSCVTWPYCIARRCVSYVLYVLYVSCVWHDLVVFQDVWRPYGSDRVRWFMCHMCYMFICVMRVTWPCCIPRRRSFKKISRFGAASGPTLLMLHIWMSHVAYMISHVARMNESCHSLHMCDNCVCYS